MEADRPLRHEATPEEARQLFDQVCMRYLSIPGEVFLEKWKNGEIAASDADQDFRVSRVVSLLPLILDLP